MTSAWEAKFTTWASGPGATEQTRSDNAVRVVTECLRDAGVLDKYKLDIFPQGSYRNRTNIPQESDVDICVATNEDFVFFAEYPDNGTHAEYGNSSSSVVYSDFKEDVAKALQARFSSEGYTRRPKCFKVHSNTYRVDVDVVPAFAFRWYRTKGSREYISGTKFIADDGAEIENYPNQHYANGNAKADTTARRFKKVVRILKRLQFELMDAGFSAKKYAPSYALECAAYNVSNAAFSNNSYYEIIRSALIEMYTRAKETVEPEPRWFEVNGIKYFFYVRQPWTKEAIVKFTTDAWGHVGYQ